MVDPEGKSIQSVYPTVIVDARMLKSPPEPIKHNAKLYIGLGPGFIGGSNCHAAIETQRGPWLGRVITDGPTQIDSGVPEQVGNKKSERALYAPIDGAVVSIKQYPFLFQIFF